MPGRIEEDRRWLSAVDVVADLDLDVCADRQLDGVIRGVRHPGCDAPPAWCDVAHGVARRHRGTITPDNALLLCRRHHRLLDEGNWTISIDGWEATFTHPSGRVVQAGRARGRPSGTDPPGEP